MPISARNSSRRISPGCTAQPAAPSFLILTLFSVSDFFPHAPALRPAMSVVIRYLHVVRIPLPPKEAHTKLIVDANAVLANTVSAQSLQPVAGGNSQILHAHGCVKCGHFPFGHVSQTCRR